MKYVTILIFLTFSCIREPQQIKFNKEIWKNGDWKKRGSMVDNIIHDSILIGKNRNQIADLLYEKDCLTDTTITMFYYRVDLGKAIGPLGLGGSWLFDLRVQFDSTTNKVVYVDCRD